MPRSAAWLALVIAGLALAVAHASQQLGGLQPCELCLWQRVPYWVVLGLGAAAVAARRLSAPLLWLAVLALAGNAVLAFYHAGVELHFWPNFLARCVPAGPRATSVDDLLRQMQTLAPVACDEPAIRVLGLSMAGWNALYAAAGGAMLGWTLTKEPRA
jgi:disulfide bond formation protein DsbB